MIYINKNFENTYIVFQNGMIMEEKLNDLIYENKRLKEEIERLRKYISLPGYERRALIEIYSKFAERSVSPIILTDEHEFILYANEAFCNLLEHSKENIVNKNLRQFTNREEFSSFQVNTELRKKGIASAYESILIKNDGTNIPVHISASPVLNDENKLICIMAIIMDLRPFLKSPENINKLNW
jgi:PAS domain S-box-containing protein